MSSAKEIDAILQLIHKELRDSKIIAQELERQGLIHEGARLAQSNRKLEQLATQMNIVQTDDYAEALEQLNGFTQALADAVDRGVALDGRMIQSFNLGKGVQPPGRVEFTPAAKEFLLGMAKNEGVSMAGNNVGLPAPTEAVKPSLFDGLQRSLVQGAKVGLATGTTEMVTEVAKKHLPEQAQKFLADNPAAEGLVRLALPALLMVVAEKFGDQIPQSKQISEVCSLAVEGAARDGVQTAIQYGLPMLAEVAALASSGQFAKQLKDKAETPVAARDDLDIEIEEALER